MCRARERDERIQTQKAHIQDFPYCNMNNTVSASNRTDSHLHSSSTRPLSRRIHHRNACVGQLMALPPESPSPICSHGTPQLPTEASSANSDIFYSEIDSQFPSSRNQSFGTSCNENNNYSSCYCEIDEWLEHANKFCKLSKFQTKNHSSSESGVSLDQIGRRSSEEDKLSMSSICKTFLDHELYSFTLPSIKEESTVYEGQSRLACINSTYGASKPEGDHGRTKLLTRPKPYNAFLNEVEMQKLEAERDTWKRAKHFKLLDRMRRKEAAIDDWELEQTRIAMEKMKKLKQNLENELEIKQLKVSAKTQKKLCMVKQKAEKQKRNLRRTTIEKISAATNSSETQTCRSFTCLRL